MNRIRVPMLWCSWFCAALLLAACSLVPPEAQPAPETFILNLPAPGPSSAPAATPLVLSVSMPRAVPGLDDSGMVYVERAFEWRRYARHRWIRPPARMLEPLLVEALEADRYYRAVVAADPAGIADRRLETEILALEQRLVPGKQQARVSLRAQLIDLHSRRLMGSGTFTEVEPMSTEDPYAGVIAVNRALERVLKRLARFCRQG